MYIVIYKSYKTSTHCMTLVLICRCFLIYLDCFEQEDWVLCRVFNKNKGESSHINPSNIEHHQATVLGRWSANAPAHRERCTSAISSMASLGMERHTLVGWPHEVVSYAAVGVDMETRSAMDEFRFLMEFGPEEEERGSGVLASEFMQ